MAPIVHIIDPDPDTVIVLKNPCKVFAPCELEEERRSPTMSEVPVPPDDVDHPQPPSPSPRQEPALVETPEDSSMYTLDEGSTALAEPSSGVHYTPSPILPEEPEEESIHYHVSSRHLILASATFKRMLAQDGFAESVRNEADGLYHTTAHDWDAEAFLVVLRIVHGRNKLIPRKQSLEMLAKIAVLEDYYNFGETLETFTEMWIQELTKTPIPIHQMHGRDLVLWIWVAWVFDMEQQFRNTTATSIRQITESFPTLDLPIPARVSVAEQGSNVRCQKSGMTCRRSFKLQTSLNFDNATMSESQKLLHEHPSDSDSEPEHERKASPRHLSPSPSSSRTTSVSPAPPGSRPNGNIKRQSSFAQARPDGAPRTPNRVRFEEPRRSMNGDNGGGDWLELDGDDYLDGGDGRERTQRLPLLTGIEAPSVTVAEESFNPEDHLENARPRSGMRSAFMNMANSIIGAGIIGQPYAVRNAGLVTGTALLIGLTIVVDWTIRLIVINSKLSGTDSFQATVQHCFGKSGLIAISLAQWLLRAIMILLILGISFPLSLYRDISKLAKASGLALVSMTIIIVTVVTQAFRVPAELKGQLRGNLIIRPGIFEAIGVIAFAFVCHHNSLLIYGSLRKPTIDRFTRVTHYSTSISLVACLVMALTGYLTFGDKTLGNVLNNFPNDNLMVNIARLCFGLNMLTTLPLEAFVCREVMTNYWFPDEPYHPNRHLIFTTSLVVSALTLSLLTCDLGIVFELFGATSACALAFILPPLCYMKLSQRSWKTYLAGAVAAFGGIVMVISIIKTTSKTMMGNSEGAKCS
ncbi:hypothetical protein J4E83_006356 [Alternaria metachromatica]|uniref:uncharacterized protein n=1 Tax=Alternaria metachromatica TaxID=283354 RepID=UPI0020C255BA|nr:uncharacterized protein J4E83_006356 [Alternaria metachromatica]KAI4616776.1 hypothetical protein J4E83_006356 [Alternaria metachromatica]